MWPRRPLRLRPAACALVLVIGVACMPADARAVFGDTPADTVKTSTVLGEIVLEGNTRTDTDLILREMGLTLGQPFAYEDLDPVWDHLEDIGWFAFVDMEFDDADPGAVVLNVYLEEDTTLEYGPLVRFDRRHKYQFGGHLAERNLRGKGEILEAAISVYHLQRAELAWTHPWLLGVRGLEVELSAAAENADFVFRPFRYHKWDSDLQIRWNFSGPFFMSGGAGYGWFEQRDDFAWPATDGGPTKPTYVSGTSTHRTLSLAAGLDSRDNRYYPSRGIYVEGTGRRWLSDDFDSYNEAVANARFFVPVPLKEHVLALRAWGRRTSGPAHLDNVLFFGGPETVRGYRFGLQEGDEGYLLSVEYRIPLFIMPISPRGELIGAGLHAFADAGDAWYHVGEAGEAKQSWGAGVHLNLDTLNLRFEAAQNRDGDWRFEFMDVFNF
ncbi:MAG: BamA/TamA family outer membrane protein [bacterium]|nr:BamA/TamA family outer membrane protein [bacterium]